MTTPIFVTQERAEVVYFSRAVWAASDGFVVRRPDAGRYTGYGAIAATPGALLAAVRGQVQCQTALRAGVPAERIVEFPDQETSATAASDARHAAGLLASVDDEPQMPAPAPTQEPSRTTNL